MLTFILTILGVILGYVLAYSSGFDSGSLKERKRLDKKIMDAIEKDTLTMLKEGVPSETDDRNFRYQQMQKLLISKGKIRMAAELMGVNLPEDIIHQLPEEPLKPAKAKK